MHLSLSMKMLFFFTEISFSRDMRLSCRSFSEFSAWFSWFFRASIDWQISFTSPTNLKQNKQHMSEAPRHFFFFFLSGESCLHVYPDQKLVIWSSSENFAVAMISKVLKMLLTQCAKEPKISVLIQHNFFLIFLNCLINMTKHNMQFFGVYPQNQHVVFGQIK